MAPKKTKSYTFPKPIENLHFIGHRQVQDNFLKAWESRDKYPIHPVWMLSGPRGIGKATLAYHIARFVFRNSESNDNSGGLFGNDGDTANEKSQIKSLITTNADDHIYQKMLDGGLGDFFVIDMANNIDSAGAPKPDGANISVYTVRATIEKMQLSSMEGGWRIVLIDSVDELNRNAGNAILKLLEEPPEHTLFLLVAHQLAGVLPTIRSRSRVEKMMPLDYSELRALFDIMLPDEELSTALLKLAAGSFGKIADLKKDGGGELYEDLLNLLENKKSDSGQVMAISTQIAKNPALYGILSDAAAHFGLAEEYPNAGRDVAEITNRYLDPEIAIFKIITDIKKSMA